MLETSIAACASGSPYPVQSKSGMITNAAANPVADWMNMPAQITATKTGMFTTRIVPIKILAAARDGGRYCFIQFSCRSLLRSLTSNRSPADSVL